MVKGQFENMEGIGRGRLFIGAMKLLSKPETIRYSSPVHTCSQMGFGVTHPCWSRPVHRSDKQSAPADPI
jgi:hypothetical protein